MAINDNDVLRRLDPIVSEYVNRPIRVIEDTTLSNLKTSLARVTRQLPPATATSTSVASTGIPKQLLTVDAQESPSKQQDRVFSLVSVSYTHDGTDTAFAGARVWFTGYKGNVNPVLMADSSSSPIAFLCETTKETVTVTMQPYSGSGAVAYFGAAITTSLTLNGVVSPPTAPSIAQSLIGTSTGFQFAFTQEAGLLRDVIQSYKVYHGTSSVFGSSTVYKTYPQDPSNAGGTIVVQETQPNGTTMYYWVTAVNTSGLESSPVAAQSGAVVSGSQLTGTGQLINADQIAADGVSYLRSPQYPGGEIVIDNGNFEASTTLPVPGWIGSSASLDYEVGASVGTGYDMLQWMLMSSGLRATKHLAGTKLDGVTSSNHLYSQLSSGRFYWTKGDSGWPWDIQSFDDNFIYLGTTENGWTTASAGKRFESLGMTLTSVNGSGVYQGTITGGASNAYVGYRFSITGFTNGSNNLSNVFCTASTATSISFAASTVTETHAGNCSPTYFGVPFAKRLMNIGDYVRSSDARLAIYTACGTATYTSIGHVQVTLTGPYTETITGAGGNLPSNLTTIHLEYEWSLDSSYNRVTNSTTRETFTLCEPYGLIAWQSQLWNGSSFNAPNDATHYNILTTGTTGIPFSDPCGLGVDGGGNGAALATSGAQSGNQSLKVSSSAQYGGAASAKKWRVTPGEQYLIGGYVRSDGTSNPEIQLNFVDGSGGYITGAHAGNLGPGLPTSWTLVTGTNTAPANAVYAYASLQNNTASGSGICYFDNVYACRIKSMDAEISDGNTFYKTPYINNPVLHNGVYNGSFEYFPSTQTIADGWKIFDSTSGFTAARSTTANVGTYAQALTNNGGEVGIACLPFSVKPNLSYQAECYARSTVANPGTMYFRIWWYTSSSSANSGGAGVSYTDLVAAGGPTVANTYQAFAFQAVAPSNALYARIVLYNYLGTSNTMLFDGVSWGVGNFDPSTGLLMSKGGIPPATNGAFDAYACTSSSITINWSTITIYRADNTTTGPLSGSRLVTGLSPSTTYYFYPYYDDQPGSLGFVTGGSGSDGTAHTAAQRGLAAAQGQNLNARIALSDGPVSYATVAAGSSGGGSGGGGSASGCVRSTMFVEEKSKGVIQARLVEVGDYLRNGSGWIEVIYAELRRHDVFIRVTVAGHNLEVTPTHPFTAMDENCEDIPLIPAAYLSPMNQLYTREGADFIERIEVVKVDGHKMVIGCSGDHTFYAGETEPYILAHNMRPSPS